MSGFLALLDPLLRRPALVVEENDDPVRPGERGDDEAHPGKEFAQVMLDLGDHSPRPVPRRGLILEAFIQHQRGVAGSAPGPGEQALDRPLQHLIGREPDGVGHVPLFSASYRAGSAKAASARTTTVCSRVW